MGNRYVYKKRRYICAKGMVEIEEHAPVYEDEELEKEATCRKFRQVRQYDERNIMGSLLCKAAEPSATDRFSKQMEYKHRCKYN